MNLLPRIIIKNCAIACVTGLISVGMLSPAYSHHSFAMYDTVAEKTVTGKLIRFIPGANHAQILFTLIDEQGEQVYDDKGEEVVWGVELGPAARISQQGVTVKSFPVGTILTATLHPLRDGRPFGAMAEAGIIKCGSELPANGCNAETGESFLRSSPVNETPITRQ
ncbi:DUF6152 family protein [Gammaproteobacteria bacterium]|jgi:hypothetical protein|nr:DUF6152 family protein [Gammaproteobacteria bacterium]